MPDRKRMTGPGEMFPCFDHNFFSLFFAFRLDFSANRRNSIVENESFYISPFNRKDPRE